MSREITLKIISEVRNFEREHRDIQKLGRFVVVLAYNLGLRTSEQPANNKNNNNNNNSANVSGY
jgi:hypothetical protein